MITGTKIKNIFKMDSVSFIYMWGRLPFLHSTTTNPSWDLYAYY